MCRSAIFIAAISAAGVQGLRRANSNGLQVHIAYGPHDPSTTMSVAWVNNNTEPTELHVQYLDITGVDSATVTEYENHGLPASAQLSVVSTGSLPLDTPLLLYFTAVFRPALRLVHES
jgi:hypothetical protein